MDLLEQAVPVKLKHSEYEPTVDSGKPPIIFIHGLFQNRNSFHEVNNSLTEKTKRKIYSLDLRGHGSSPYSDDYNIFAFAADVELFIEEKKLKKVTFICNSFSSRIATIIANHKPDLIEKLVFVDITPYSDDDRRMEYSKKTFEKMRLILKRCRSLEDIDLVAQTVYKFLDSDKSFVDFVIKESRNFLTYNEDGTLTYRSDLDALFDAFLAKKIVLTPLNVFSGPTLFIYGEATLLILKDVEDPLLTIYFPLVKKVGIPGASHMLILEKTKEFIDIVDKFLSE